MFPIGVVAGIISSSVGMASLATYPSLLYIGDMPAIAANVTNTSSMIFTGMGSGLSSIPELRGHVRQLLLTLVCTFIGSIGGTYLLLSEPSASFKKVVPFFILIAGIMILWPKKPLNENSENHQRKVRVWEYLIGGLAFLIAGIYMGYFGAGAGLILIAVLSHITDEPYPVYNAIRNVSSLSANVVAMTIYAIKATVYWVMVIPLGIGLFIGGYIGPKIVRVIPEKILKTVVGICALVLSVVLFYQTYF
ncbi:sulfite exporter TauE/SafE family protein [Acetilactobacillus jinshanensis]|uniref:Probable membrane transporter protein n=1 Tax=Acetilactobacillus jinshanensis TaxID=1720083 RepID=A0A4P6ZKA6_9LACO|nr:sulfite exporter TauE/SafE family protein [Acetilactobacillus jinshanensis]QBP18201.1 sulfite exporter TauE/SafE family protein [Acetilactobacillus jinshanensis]URL61070.1 sulfite exporter TauE/SafE family protein [uncultured bacterium]